MTQHESALRRITKNRRFWVTAAAFSSVALICYDWYSDRYASPSTRFLRIKEDYEISTTKLRQIRKAFVCEMDVGLSEDDQLAQCKKKSSLKMLSSHIYGSPAGDEQGVFYTLDWGGSNYRVLRIAFPAEKHGAPQSTEFKIKIEQQYQHADNAQLLFDYLAKHLQQQIAKHGNGSETVPVGFTFSFPMTQPRLDSGILLEWTKGFDIPDVVGQDVVQLMHASFAKHAIDAKIHAVCNDTVGTLLAAAYDHENVRVGLIIGTGTNACYIEPTLARPDVPENGLIINIEWGNYAKLLPRKPTDLIMDEQTPNPGAQFAEKMISGYYVGELVRLLALEVFREKITNFRAQTPLNEAWQFQSPTVSDILGAYNTGDVDGVLQILHGHALVTFDRGDAEIFANLCALIVNRSADLAATLLLGTLEKTGLYTCTRKDDRNPFERDRFELTGEYRRDENKTVTVGIDGSVYQHVPGYAQRMRECMRRVVGAEIESRVTMVHSSDGSGKGAALAVAAHLAQKQ